MNTSSDTFPGFYDEEADTIAYYDQGSIVCDPRDFEGRFSPRDGCDLCASAFDREAEYEAFVAKVDAICLRGEPGRRARRLEDGRIELLPLD